MMNSMKSMFSRLTTITPLEKQSNIDSVKNAEPEDENIDANTITNASANSDESINVIENPALHNASEELFTLSSDSSPDHTFNSTPDMESIYIYHTDNTYNYREFFYLHDNRLAKEYTCYDTKTIHICTFAMNHNCSYQEEPLPFLQFLLVPSEKRWVFPHFQFQCSQNLEMENMQIYFLNECTKQMLGSFVVEGHLQDMENMNHLYRGFIECGEHDVVVVFDMTQHMELMLRQQAMWFIVMEIANQNLVSPFVSDFFGKHTYMTSIETQHDMIMELPHLLYLYDVEKREHVKHPLTMLEPRSFHPVYGHFYYFVNEHPSGSPQQYVRCVVFMANITVIDNENTEEKMLNDVGDSESSPVKDVGDSESSPVKDVGDSVSESSPVKDLGDDFETDSSDDSFDELLSEDGGKDVGDFDSESSPLPLFNRSPKVVLHKDIGDSVSESSPKVVLHKDIGDTTLLPFSSIIIFNEDNTKLWCVKTESLFTPLNI